MKSDDETESVATTSDIESIPNVSENVPNDPEVDISKTNWTEDGLFKIPQVFLFILYWGYIAFIIERLV